MDFLFFPVLSLKPVLISLGETLRALQTDNMYALTIKVLVLFSSFGKPFSGERTRILPVCDI